jgi:ParB-like chromosome segregation protein Spo0J
LAGHDRLEAARRLGMVEAPTLEIPGLSDSEKRAVVIAANRLPERAVWDFDLLKGHFAELIKVDFEVELTGFSTGEIDLLIDNLRRTRRLTQPTTPRVSPLTARRSPTLAISGSLDAIALSAPTPDYLPPMNL